MTISAEDKIIHYLKDKVGLDRADELVAELKGQKASLRERLSAIVTDELGEPAPHLVERLKDLIDEARIRARQDALYRATEK